MVADRWTTDSSAAAAATRLTRDPFTLELNTRQKRSQDTSRVMDSWWRAYQDTLADLFITKYVFCRIPSPRNWALPDHAVELGNWHCMIRKSPVTEAWDSTKHILCYILLVSMIYFFSAGN